MGNNGNSDRLCFPGLQMMTAAMKVRSLLLGRKAMTNLDSILKSRDIILPTKVRLSQNYVFSSSHVWMCELAFIKKAEHWWLDAFELWCCRRTLRVPWTARRSNQSVLKYWIFFGKDWCWSWNSNPLTTWCKELTYLKRPWCWERLKVGREGDDRGWDDCMASLTQ